MKRVASILVILLVSVLGMSRVSALAYYEAVNVTTSFVDSLDPLSFNEIYCVLGLSNEEEKSVILSKNNDFTYVINDVPKGTVSFEYAMVDDDRLGKYKVTGKVITYPDGKTVDVRLIVDKINREPSTNPLSEDQLNIIRGGRIQKDPGYGKRAVVDGNGNLKYVTQEEYDKIHSEYEVYEKNGTSIIVTKNPQNTQPTSGTSFKTTESTSVGETTPTEKTTRIIKDEKTTKSYEEEREEHIKQNNLVTKILLIGLGILIVVGLLFVGIKIMNANK